MVPEKIVEIVDARRRTTDIQVITKAHPKHSSGELKTLFGKTVDSGQSSLTLQFKQELPDDNFARLIDRGPLY